MWVALKTIINSKWVTHLQEWRYILSIDTYHRYVGHRIYSSHEKSHNGEHNGQSPESITHWDGCHRDCHHKSSNQQHRFSRKPAKYLNIITKNMLKRGAFIYYVTVFYVNLLCHAILTMFHPPCHVTMFFFYLPSQ